MSKKFICGWEDDTWEINTVSVKEASWKVSSTTHIYLREWYKVDGFKNLS